MYRNLTLLLFVMLALVGCSLSSADSGDEDGGTVRIVDEATQEVTEETVPTQEEVPTFVPTEDTGTDDEDTDNNDDGDSAGSDGDVIVDCTVRTSWPAYTVAAGDTTSTIARRVDSTVSAIADANCLTDASRIRVGQTLHVPRLPAPDVTASGFLSVTPYNRLAGDFYQVEGGQNVNIIWSGASRLNEVANVDFLFYPPDGLSYQTIGSDDTRIQGIEIVWQVPFDVQGFVIARGKNAAGEEVAYSPKLEIASTIARDDVVGTMYVSPIVRTDNNTTIVRADQPIQLTWDNLNAADQNVVHVEFYMEPDAGHMALMLLGTDDNVSDGAGIDFEFTPGLSGEIYALGRIPGQNHHSMRSRSRRVRAESGRQVINAGRLDATPIVRDSGNTRIVESESTVTIGWYDHGDTSNWDFVEFIFTADVTDEVSTIGGDNNFADGVSTEWIVPRGTTGIIMASVQLKNGDRARVDVPPLFIAAELPVVATQGRVTADPSTSTDKRTVVTGGAQVTLTWATPPVFNDAWGVTFYLRRTGIGAPLEMIASDTNLSDGASVQWQVPASFEGTLIAQAEVPGGVLASEGVVFVTPEIP